MTVIQQMYPNIIEKKGKREIDRNVMKFNGKKKKQKNVNELRRQCFIIYYLLLYEIECNDKSLYSI